MASKIGVLAVALLLVFAATSDITFAKTITLGSGETITVEDLRIPPEGALYKEAAGKLKNFPKDFKPDDTIKSGWKDNPELENILKNNKEAIKLFKKATLQQSKGFIFGEKPGKLQSFPDIPNYIDKMKLFKLLLLEARRFESQKQYKEAADNYLAALRFMHHISQQRYGVMMAATVNAVCSDTIYPCLSGVVKNNNFAREDYRHLSNELLLVSVSQDFLKTAFEEEQKFNKNARTSISFPLARLNKEIDSNESYLFNILIVAAENNRPELYEQKLKDLKISLVNEISNGKREIRAKAFVLSSMPPWPIVITRYHVFYNKLNTLITGFAVKLYRLDNGSLPDNLGQLIPKYLSAIPVDSFNNFEPLAYKKEGNDFTISSVGAPKPSGDEKLPYDTGAIIFSSK